MELRAEVRARDPGFVRDVGKCSVAIVVIENVASELRDVQIGKAVVVVISANTSKTITRAGDPSLVGDIGKTSVAAVAVQGVAHHDAAVVEVAAVHKVDVLPAIAIKVCHADARAELHTPSAILG